MKPESRHALMELISYGVEELSNEDAAQLLSRVHECPECAGQWVLFEKTYTVLSQTGETEVSVERSQKMWLACVEHAQHKVHSAAKSEVLPVSSHRESSPREGDRRPSFASRFAPRWLGALNPRFEFALAGAAALILAASLLFSPSSSSQTTKVAALPSVPQSLTRPVSFKNPPRATTGMLDYHSTMAFEPFSDHVAPTLVSFTATQP